MRQPNVDDSVRLIHDLPDLLLPAGAVGRVCSTWFGSNVAYEVEFEHLDDANTRVLLREDDVELIADDGGSSDASDPSYATG